MVAAFNIRRLLMLVILKKDWRGKERHVFGYERFTRKRRKKGQFHRLATEAQLADEELFFKMFWMIPTKFETILSLVSINFSKPNALREPIGPAERLSVTL